MKRLIQILLFSTFFVFLQSKGQTLPIYSQYMFNEYLINAAYSGTYNFSPIIFNNRTQWVGFGDSAPKTASITVNTPFGSKSSVGSLVQLDQTGPISRTQLQVNYGHVLILNKESNLSLSMALSGTYNIQQFNYQTGMTYSEITNGIIDNYNQTSETYSDPDLNLDFLLLNNFFDFGISLRNLLAPEKFVTENEGEIVRYKYLLIHGSFLGANSQKSSIGVIPSFLIRKIGLTSFNSLTQLDINIKTVYKNKIWSGFSYRTQENIFNISAGFNSTKIFIGYSYDIGTSSNLSSYHNGSHNIAIGYKISAKNKRNLRLQSPYNLNINDDWQKIRLFNTRHQTGN